MRKTYLPLLAALGLLLAGLITFAGPAQAQDQPAPTAVPGTRPDGSIVHVVKEGESLWLIAIQYAEVLGMSAEDALPYLQELNNNPAFINPGDEILIRAGNPATPTEASGGEATPEPTVAPPTEVPTEPPPTEQIAGTICVGAFHDANGDGQRNQDEALVADAAIAISRTGATVSTYITDGESEPFCFELTEADSYQLQLYPPAGFTATTEDNWAVSIANGESYTVLFGLSDVQAPADAAPTDAADPGQTAPTGEAAPAASGGLPGNLGLIILGVVVVLVVLAVIGVVLLRRG
ncbi:MAG: LysM peptidoglycan-binding domain-containing protein [Candidatus Promineofilum sp.]|nr:LysM peptidoglycan-binding domain-containing protein [Promineifilum sp.]